MSGGQKPGARPVEGGVDHGGEWTSLVLQASTSPSEAASAIVDAYNREWLRQFVSLLADWGPR